MLKKYWTITVRDPQSYQSASMDRHGDYSFNGCQAFSFESEKEALAALNEADDFGKEHAEIDTYEIEESED